MRNPIKRTSLFAFTLVELLVIVVLIGILAGTAIVKYGPVTEKAYSAEAFSMLAQIVSAENAYKVESSGSVYTETLSALDLDNTTSINFDYSVNTSVGYAQATPKTTKPKNNYYMCMNSGSQKSGGSAPTSCP